MRVLGIETSCDETACAVVQENGAILSHVLLSQLKTHREYGGVVPEVAARAHLASLSSIVEQCIQTCPFDTIDGVAATCGPGLIGGVMVGATFAKALAFSLDKPFIAVNHLEAHALTVRMTQSIPFPFLLLLVSGGHCQILLVHNIGRYKLLGATKDDAVGEAFDKTAKLLNLGYPGGPAIEQQAKHGDPHRFALPKPLLHEKSCDFSFSGLKTAVKTLIMEQHPLEGQDVADVCASFQETVSQILVSKCRRALTFCQDQDVHLQHLVIAGGVAANQSIRQAISCAALDFKVTCIAPPIGLCTDNGAMVAWAGLEKLRLGKTDPVSTPCRPRWPLESLA